MSILTKYTLRCLKKNKVRTLVTIIGIILSVALFTAVSEGAYSGQQYLVRVAEAETGAFHGYWSGVSDAELEELRGLPEVERTETLDGVGWAMANPDSYYPYLRISSMSEGLTELLPVRILQGRMPENNRELLISDRSVPTTKADLRVGQTLTLTVGQRVTTDGLPLDENNPYMVDGETLTGTHEETYTIVGMYDRFPNEVESYSLPGTLVLTVGDTGTEHTVLYTLDRVGRVNDFFARHSFGSSGDVNRDLLLYSGASGNRNVIALLYGLVAILFGLIFFGSVALIYNSFSISVSERTKQFGLLKSIGATKKQIQHAVLVEALLLCVIAIPLGLLVGCGGIGLTLRFLRPAFSRIINLEGAAEIPIRLVLNFPALAVAAGIGLLTALISAWIPAKRAMRLAPITAIRQSADVKVSKREVKVSPITRKLFGFPGMLASKYFKRSRKQYRSTVVSLFMSIVLFVSAMSFAGYLRQDVAESANSYRADLIVEDRSGSLPADTNWEEVFAALSAAEGVTDAARCAVGSMGVVLNTDTELLSEDALRYIPDSIEGKTPMVVGLFIVPDADYAELCAAADVRPEDGDVLLYGRNSTHVESNGGMVHVSYDLIREDVKAFDTELTWQRTPMPGYVLQGSVSDDDGRIISYIYRPASDPDDGTAAEEIEIPAEAAEGRGKVRVAGFIDELPLASTRDGCAVYTSESHAEKIFHGLILLDKYLFFAAENHTQARKTLELKLSDLSLGSRLSVWDLREGREGTEAFLLILDVFTFGFITLISLIAAANVFNTISTNISLRRREFATLKSVGMERKGFNRMMRFECLLYGCKALAWGLPVSILLSWLISKAVNNAIQTGFRMPWTAIAIAVGSVFLVVGATMLYAMGRLNRENIVETLRNENI